MGNRGVIGSKFVVIRRVDFKGRFFIFFREFKGEFHCFVGQDGEGFHGCVISLSLSLSVN